MKYLKKTGVNIESDERDAQYAFHAHYGALKADDIPSDFGWGNDDMPDQDAEGAPTECTGYSQADNEFDTVGIVMSPDFSYAAGVEAEGAQPNTNGCDFRASLQGVINRGVLPRATAPFTAKVQGELYVSNINNWLPFAPQALAYAESSYRWATMGPHDIFDNIRNTLYLAKKGVSAATRFYPEWVGANVTPDGIARMPDWHGSFGLHDWAIKRSTTVFLAGPQKGALIRGGETFIAAKTWQGREFGNGGWLYFDRETINQLFALPNAGAAVITKDGNRMWSLLVWMSQKFPALIFYLPRLWRIINLV